MDVHYSLPRDADLAKGCDRETGQVRPPLSPRCTSEPLRLLTDFSQKGTLSITIRNGPPGMTAAPPDQEIYQRFAPFGDIKLVFPDPRRPELKYIEYFDSRGAVKAYDHLNGTPFAGGTLDLQFEWDKPAPAPPPVPVAPPPAANGGFGYQQPAVNAYGAPVPPPGAPPHGASPYPAAPGGASPYPGGGAPPPPPPPPAAAPHGVDHAKKMQDLLATLVANNQGALAPPQPQASPFGAPPPPPAGSAAAPPHNLGYPSYAPGPTPAPAAQAPYAGASPLPPAIGSPLGAAAPGAAASSLPASVASLLAQAAGAAPPPPAAAPPAGGSTPQQQPNGGYSPLPGAGAAGGAPASLQGQGQGQAQVQAPAQVQALLALLVRLAHPLTHLDGASLATSVC